MHGDHYGNVVDMPEGLERVLFPVPAFLSFPGRLEVAEDEQGWAGGRAQRLKQLLLATSSWSRPPKPNELESTARHPICASAASQVTNNRLLLNRTTVV